MFSFVQFHIESISSTGTDESCAILLDYSLNGGIEWVTFYYVTLPNVDKKLLHQVMLPSRSLAGATRLRWSQQIGSIIPWAIDEIYIGGEYYAKSLIEDDFTSIETTRSNWLFISGGTIEASCGSSNSTLHFPSNTSADFVYI